MAPFIRTSILILAAVAPVAQASVILPKFPFQGVDHHLTRLQRSSTSTSTSTSRRRTRNRRITGGGSSSSTGDDRDPWNLLSRGGARGGGGGDGDCCGDSDVHLALKAGFSTALEAIGLVAVLAGAQKLSSSKSMTMIPDFLTKVVGGLPVLQWASLFVVIFGSAELKAVVDGGVSAASKQILQPSVTPGEGQWYENLKKPWYTPPGWVFPIMWLIIAKPTQMWAASRILKTAASAGAASASSTQFPWAAMAVYCTHLSLGDTWNQVFFGCQRIRLGVGVIGTFWSVLVASAVAFGNIDTTAGLLILPTVAWVTVASSLNIGIYRLNGEK